MNTNSTRDSLLIERKGPKEKASLFRPKHRWPSYRVMMVSLAATVIAYTHFFGVSYLNSKMAVLGFEGIAFDLGAGQSMYFAVEGYSQGLSIILGSFLSHTAPFLISGVLLGFYFIYLIWKPSIDSLLIKFSPRMPETPSKSISLPRWLQKCWEFSKALAVLMVTTFVTYVFQVLFILVFLIIISALLSVMRLGNDVGELVGNKLVSGGICKSIDWEGDEKGNNKYKGCRKVNLKDGQFLTGIRVYKQENTEYLITNEGSYEVLAGQVVSFRPFYCRPSENRPGDTRCDKDFLEKEGGG